MTGDELDRLLADVAAGFEGDADRAVAAFTDDARLRDNVAEPWVEGEAELLAHFLAFGGRRERFAVEQVVADGDRAAVRYVLRFRSDAHAYAQHGTAWLALADGRIAEWDATWAEAETDLAAWGGD